MHDLFHLHQETAVVLGGTGALGSAVVAAFLDAGWRVAVTWIAQKELGRVTEREGLVLVEADLLDEQAVDRAVSEAAGDGAESRTFRAPGDRQQIRRWAEQAALDMVRRYLQGVPQRPDSGPARGAAT